jgi:hypothetical protein
MIFNFMEFKGLEFEIWSLGLGALKVHISPFESVNFCHNVAP